MEEELFEDKRIYSKQDESINKENNAYQYIVQMISDLLEKENIPSEWVSFRQSESEKAQYSSVYFYGEGNLLCRISFRGKQGYFSILTKYENMIPTTIEVKKLKSDSSFIRVPIDSAADIMKYEDIWLKIMKDAIDAIPTDFGCCSKYMMCSDAKKCVHEDIELAIHCYYRKNLREKNIFYGKNKTI